jgi:hypothetical protein
VVARVAVRESVTLAGRAERAQAARRFVSEVIGPGHPCGEVAVLLVSEVLGGRVARSVLARTRRYGSAAAVTIRYRVVHGRGVSSP